jgi:hypothetical protein
MFRIEFPEPGYDQAFFKFVDLCSAYIDRHQDGPQDAMSDPKIFRPAETGGNANAEDELEELLREDDILDDEPLIDVGDSSSEHEEDKPFWSPKNPRTNIANVLPDRLLQEIAQDTACSLELSVEKACVFITNATASKIETVNRKLDNVERNSVSLNQRRRDHCPLLNRTPSIVQESTPTSCAWKRSLMVCCNFIVSKTCKTELCCKR